MLKENIYISIFLHESLRSDSFAYLTLIFVRVLLDVAQHHSQLSTTSSSSDDYYTHILRLRLYLGVLSGLIIQTHPYTHIHPRTKRLQAIKRIQKKRDERSTRIHRVILHRPFLEVDTRHQNFILDIYIYIYTPCFLPPLNVEYGE